QRINLGRARAVSIHTGVRLLKTNARRQRKRLILRERPPQVSRNDLDALVMESPAQIRFAFDIDDPSLSHRRRSRDPNRLAECVAADFHHTQPVHLTYAATGGIDENHLLLDHFPYLRLEQVVSLVFRVERLFDVLTHHDLAPTMARSVGGLSPQIGKIETTRRVLPVPSRKSHAVLQNRRYSRSIEREQFLVIAQLAQPAAVLAQHILAPHRLFVEFDPYLENLFEVVFIVVQQFIHLAIPDQDHFRANFNRLRLHRRRAEREKRVHRLNLQLAVIQRPLQRLPHARFRERIERIHHQEAAVRTQPRSAAQIHEIRTPRAPRVITPVRRSKQIRIRRYRLKYHGASVAFAVRQDHVYAVNAKRIALSLPALWPGSRPRRSIDWRRRLLLALTLLEWIEVVQNVVPHLFEIL